MIIEFDDDLLDRWSPEQLLAVRPMLVKLTVKMRRNLRLLDGLLGVENDRPELVREHERLTVDHHEALVRVEALEHDLETARAWISTLQNRITDIEDDEVEQIYRMVGLASVAHIVVVRAARRALLAQYHPDAALAENKDRMTTRFAAASAAFDRIEALRGC